jgi:hypothetical protein
MVVWVIWMSFAFGAIYWRRDTLIILETHIVMSSLISHLVLILMFRLIITLVLRLTLLLVLCLASPMDITIAHTILVHERTTLCLDALVMTHVLIVVIIYRAGPIFLLEGFTRTLSTYTWMVHVFSIVIPVPLVQRLRCKK